MPADKKAGVVPALALAVAVGAHAGNKGNQQIQVNLNSNQNRKKRIMKSTLIAIFIMLTSVWSYSQDQSSNDSGADKNYEEVVAIKNQGGFSLVDSWAKYPNGENGITELIINNLKYPEKAIKKKIEGVVIIKYVVQIDGTVDEIEVVNSVHPLLDKEAVRVISLMEKWEPSIQRGKPVKTAYNQDIRFEL